MYEYIATLRRVVDGDTIDLLVDQGLDNLTKGRFRLAGIDCRELNDTDPEKRKHAKEAQYWLEKKLPTAENTITIRTIKVAAGEARERWGKYLVWVYVPDIEGSVNMAMVEAGLAVRYDGKGSREAAHSPER